MASIDPETNAVVVRVVYDGPPLAGKTTSVRALARGLGGEVFVPEERDGRTVFFDWLDYTGGLFEGHAIRCQIISVPGQATLAGRRRHLLGSADVVVFVGDSGVDAADTMRRYLQSLRSVLAKTVGPPVGIVLQANKRDQTDAVPLPAIQHMLDEHGLKVAIVESVATEGSGIRETFVFAVRLALDRVRELIRLDMLPTEPPSINGPDDLMNAMRSAEGGTFRALPTGELSHTRLSDIRAPVVGELSAVLRQAIGQSDPPVRVAGKPSVAAGTTSPKLPDASLPSGMIWPPVEGRMMLHAIMHDPPSLSRARRGHWTATTPSGWHVQSPADGRFDSEAQGRASLLDWARVHVAGHDVLSRDRCIALAADGQGQYRLWQFVRRETSLLDRFSEVLRTGPKTLAEFLVGLLSLHAMAADTWPNAGYHLALDLRKLAADSARPRFIGTVPYPVTQRPDIAFGDGDGAGVDWVAKQLGFAQASLHDRAADVLSAVEALAESNPASVRHHVAGVRELMTRM